MRGRALEQSCKSTKTSTKCLFQASWPSSLLADGARRITEDAEETSTPTVQVYPRQHDRNAGCSQRDSELRVNRQRQVWCTINIMDGMWLLRCSAAVLRHLEKSQNSAISEKQRYFPGQETSDATYRHQLCVAVVSHTHAYAAHTHTDTHTHTLATHADIHLPAMLTTRRTISS